MNEQNFQDQLSPEVMMSQAAQNAPEVSDENFPRYAMSFFLPVPLYRMHGNNAFGDFNPKDERGRNAVNYNYFPPFALMPLYGGRFEIPYEPQPTESDEPVKPAEFDYSAFMKQPKNGVSSVYRSPKKCAEFFALAHGSWGGNILNALTGFHITDKDRGLRAARAIVDIVLPVRNENIFPPSVRIKNGVEFSGPFLDELLDFVVKNSLHRINEANLSDADTLVAKQVYQEIRNYLTLAVQLANRTLNETEAEINDPKGLKRTYDPPDLTVQDAPVATDLYALAHTNRVELDMKQLTASENIGKGLSDPMLEVAQQMKQFVEKMGTPSQVPSNVMSLDEVKKMLDQQREEMMKEFEEKMKSFAASAQTTETTAKKKTT